MAKENSQPHKDDLASTAVIPIPIALYDSNGLLFELFDGGQPCRSFAIRWETIRPIRVTDQTGGNTQQSSMRNQREQNPSR